MRYLAYQADLASPAGVSAYDELPLWSALAGSLLLDEVPLAGVQAFLDLGCGTGFPLLELAERLGPACRAHGLDPWEQALARARQKAEVWGLDNVELTTGSADALPYADARFDLVVSNLGLNNFARPEAALAECRRVLRPAGRLALTTNLRGHMREFYAVFDALLDELGLAEARAALQAHVEHRQTPETLQAFLADGGFEPTRLVERVATMRFASGAALLNHHFIKLGFLGGWKRVVPEPRQPEVFALLEERLGPLTLTVPLAYVEARPLG